MRCTNCNIDLPSDCTMCPLCGAAASDDKNVLEGMYDIPYPDKLEPAPVPDRKPTWYKAAKCMTGVSLTVGTALAVAGRVKKNPELINFASALATLSGTVSYVCCKKEKGELMKGVLPLIANTALTAACAVPVNKKVQVESVLRTVQCGLMVASAYVGAPDKMKNELKASLRVTGNTD